MKHDTSVSGVTSVCRSRQDRSSRSTSSAAQPVCACHVERQPVAVAGLPFARAPVESSPWCSRSVLTVAAIRIPARRKLGSDQSSIEHRGERWYDGRRPKVKRHADHPPEDLTTRGLPRTGDDRRAVARLKPRQRCARPVHRRVAQQDRARAGRRVRMRSLFMEEKCPINDDARRFAVGRRS